MDLVTAVSKVNSFKKGTFHEFIFKSLPQTTDGSVITKVTTMSGRTGIDRTKMEIYHPSTVVRTNNDKYIIDGVIKQNTKTGSTLFIIHPRQDGKSTSVFYDELGNELDKDVALSHIKSRTYSGPIDTITIKLENLIDII